MNKEFYVYEYWRLDNNTCFYVGKGKGNRYIDMNYRSNHFKNIINKVPTVVIKVFENIDEQTAFDLECTLIHKYVFEEGYNIKCLTQTLNNKEPYLVNLTWGGEGISGHKKSLESKIKQSNKMKLVWKNSNKLKRSGKYRNKNSYLTEEYRNSQRERTINLWKNQEYREKVIKAMSKPKNIKKKENIKAPKQCIVVVDNIFYTKNTYTEMINFLKEELKISAPEKLFSSGRKLSKKNKNRIKLVAMTSNNKTKIYHHYL